MIGVITYFRFFLKKLLCDWRNHANKANHANHKISFENDVMLMLVVIYRGGFLLRFAALAKQKSPPYISQKNIFSAPTFENFLKYLCCACWHKGTRCFLFTQHMGTKAPDVPVHCSEVIYPWTKRGQQMQPGI